MTRSFFKHLSVLGPDQGLQEGVEVALDAFAQDRRWLRGNRPVWLKDQRIRS